MRPDSKACSAVLLLCLVLLIEGGFGERIRRRLPSRGSVPIGPNAGRPGLSARGLAAAQRNLGRRLLLPLVRILQFPDDVIEATSNYHSLHHDGREHCNLLIKENGIDRPARGGEHPKWV